MSDRVGKDETHEGEEGLKEREKHADKQIRATLPATPVRTSAFPWLTALLCFLFFWRWGGQAERRRKKLT